jgi:hypothetical protein
VKESEFLRNQQLPISPLPIHLVYAIFSAEKKTAMIIEEKPDIEQFVQRA